MAIDSLYILKFFVIEINKIFIHVKCYEFILCIIHIVHSHYCTASDYMIIKWFHYSVDRHPFGLLEVCCHYKQCYGNIVTSIFYATWRNFSREGILQSLQVIQHKYSCILLGGRVRSAHRRREAAHGSGCPGPTLAPRAEAELLSALPKPIHGIIPTR